MKRKREDIKNSSPNILFEDNNGASPILRSSSELVETSSDDEEVIISSQAQKRRKMANEDTLKLWISDEFKKQNAQLATRQQVDDVLIAVEAFEQVGSAPTPAKADALVWHGRLPMGNLVDMREQTDG